MKLGFHREENMSYKEDCVEAFIDSLREQNLDTYSIEIAKQSFIAGFDYGSLNGASENIKEYAVNQMKPVKDRRAKEIIDKIRSCSQGEK